jgi:preprotein translocase subunit SecG
MRKLRVIFIFISAGLIMLILFFIDYKELISKSNLSPFLGIVIMLFTIFSLVLSNRHESSNENHGKHQ